MKWWISLCSLFSGFSASFLTADQPQKKWVVYYGENLPPERFESYDVVVLEPDMRPNISLLLEQGKTVLGYISLGEVSKDRSYFKEVQEAGLLFEKNPIWRDSFYIDMRRKEWTSMVIEELIPSILFQRFSGIFIDTIDNAETLESQDPQKYKGMKDAAIRLIKTIRLHFPEIKIMLNRGFPLLPELNQEIDMFLAEEIFAVHNFKTGEDKLGSQTVYQELAGELKEAKKANPKLEVYTLDYWNPKDPSGIALIYKVQRKNGFIPYVATVKLNEIIAEPN